MHTQIVGKCYASEEKASFRRTEQCELCYTGIFSFRMNGFGQMLYFSLWHLCWDCIALFRCEWWATLVFPSILYEKDSSVCRECLVLALENCFSVFYTTDITIVQCTRYTYTSQDLLNLLTHEELVRIYKETI